MPCNNYDIVESCSTQLLNLINDIIDLSKIEAGELKINKESCRVNRILTELETTFNELKLQKGKNKLKIKANIPEGTADLAIETDPARLKQVLTNLIGNALKFTEQGKIEFGYSIRDSKLFFEVSDTGIYRKTISILFLNVFNNLNIPIKQSMMAQVLAWPFLKV